jgi:hypothetical protein
MGGLDEDVKYVSSLIAFGMQVVGLPIEQYHPRAGNYVASLLQKHTKISPIFETRPEPLAEVYRHRSQHILGLPRFHEYPLAMRTDRLQIPVTDRASAESRFNFKPQWVVDSNNSAEKGLAGNPALALTLPAHECIGIFSASAITLRC